MAFAPAGAMTDLKKSTLLKDVAVGFAIGLVAMLIIGFGTASAEPESKPPAASAQ